MGCIVGYNNNATSQTIDYRTKLRLKVMMHAAISYFAPPPRHVESSWSLAWESCKMRGLRFTFGQVRASTESARRSQLESEAKEKKDSMFQRRTGGSGGGQAIRQCNASKDPY